MCKAIVGKCCILMSLCSVVYAEPVELKGSWTFGYNFNSGDAWADGAPASSGKDYRVSNGYAFQVGYGNTGSDTTFEFPGDSLIMGNVGGTSSLFRHAGACSITITNLVLANGMYVSYYTFTYPGYAKLYGAATILSQSNAPFVFVCASDTDKYKGVKWHMATKGTAESGFAVTGRINYRPGRMDIMSSNPDYFGSVTASTNLTLGIAYSDSLGGKTDSFNGRALVLEDATLEALNPGISLAASDNRGVYVEAAGGNVSVPEGMDMAIGWPISGKGALCKVGKGLLYLANDVTTASLALKEGSLAVAEGATVSVDMLELSGGVLSVGADTGILAPGSLKVADGGRIMVQVMGSPDVGSKMPFLKAPTGTFRTGDFYVCTGSFAQVTSDVENGIETFSLVVVPVITTNGDGSSGMYLPENAADWSDSLAVHEGAAYAIVAETFNKQFKSLNSTDANDAYIFPGQSMSLKGNATSARAKVLMSSPVFEGRIGFYDYTDLQFSGDYTTSFKIKGDMDLNNSIARHENGFRLPVWDRLVVNVESTIRGGGSMYLCNFSSDNTLGTVILSGTNTFTGGAQLYGGNKTVCLRVSDERNLGGNPTVLDATSLLLNQGAMFYPIGSVTIDDLNRGIRFNGNPLTVKTDMGQTTTILSPVSANNAHVHVTGGGTLHIGNDSIPVTGNGFTVYVDDGFVKGGTARTFEAVKFIFADGTGIAADKVTDPGDSRFEYGMVITNEAAQFASSPLKVRIDYKDEPSSYDAPVPVMSIPETLDRSLDGNVEFVDNLEMGRWYLIRDNVTVDGKAFVRYSAKYEKGFAVILR